MDKEVMFQLSYGLYLLTARDGDRKNGCIINTAMQQTDEPNRISVTVNKRNYTQEMIERTGLFNLSILDESAEFATFRHFGFQSGREVDKFADRPVDLSENQVPYLAEGCCGFLSAKVCQTLDLGSHMFFLAEVTDAQRLSRKPPMTYAYYHAQVKPKPETVQGEQEGTRWICRTCGYIYDEAKEGIRFADLPKDWVCPLCKHGKDDFEMLEM